MKNGIFYTKDDMMVLIGSEPLDHEDRGYFTHIEFWHHGKMISRQEKDTISYETLLGLVKKMEDEQKSVPEVIFGLVGI